MRELAAKPFPLIFTPKKRDMDYKTYCLNKSSSRSCIRIQLKNCASKFVTFASIGYGTNYDTGYPQFSTSKKDIQEGIESSDLFNNGSIILLRSDHISKPNNKKHDIEKGKDVLPKTKQENKEVDIVEFAEVTSLRAAQAVLTGDPYNVPKASEEIRKKENLLKKAEELGVRFPNFA